MKLYMQSQKIHEAEISHPQKIPGIKIFYPKIQINSTSILINSFKQTLRPKKICGRSLYPTQKNVSDLLAYLSTLPVFPGVSKFFIKSPSFTMQRFLSRQNARISRRLQILELWGLTGMSLSCILQVPPWGTAQPRCQWVNN